ncbi:hypothetical protein Tco_0527027 [Tanacetum coccineum]
MTGLSVHDPIWSTTNRSLKSVIIEYLVKDSKRHAFWSLNEDILKITILETNTPYPLRKIRRIRACTHQRPQRNEAQYAEVVLFYNRLGIPTLQIVDSRGAIPSKTVADAKIAIQEMAEYSQKWHNGTSRSRSTKTSDGLAAIQAQLNNLGREIKKVNEKV